MNSIWAGSLEGAFFDPNKFDQCRVLNIAEQRYNKGIPSKGYYVLGVDVGRYGCMTEVVVLKVTPCHTGGLPHKQIVNIYTFQEDHFGLQAIKIKQLFNQYKANICVVDGNGLNLAHVKSLELLGTPNVETRAISSEAFLSQKLYVFCDKEERSTTSV